MTVQAVASAQQDLVTFATFFRLVIRWALVLSAYSFLFYCPPEDE